MDWPHDPSLYPPHLQTAVSRGIGLGEGAAYQPWIKTTSFGSKGTCSNFIGIKIRRPFHFLSSKEATNFLLEERNPENVDIQEQMPIFDIQTTMRLCAEFGVEHTHQGRFPTPFTIDFVLTKRIDRRRASFARSIKTAEDLLKPKVKSRLNIEYQWSAEVNLDWASVDTREFTPELLSNLRFIRQWFVDRYEPRPEASARFAEAFQHGFELGTPLEELIHKAASRTRLSDGVSLFRYGAWSNLIRVDLRRPISLDSSIILLP